MSDESPRLGWQHCRNCKWAMPTISMKRAADGWRCKNTRSCAWRKGQKQRREY